MLQRILLALFLPVLIWAQGTTPKQGLVKPSAGSTGWATSINSNFDKLDDPVYLAPYTGAVARTQSQKNSDFINFKDLGGICNGTADDTAALVAADAECISKKKTLYISGTPLIKSSLTFTGLSSWVFEGAGGNTGGNKPTSYLIKHSSVAGPLLVFTGHQIEIVGLGIFGQGGNTGDGLVIQGNGARIIRPWVAYMGQDGIRIGKDTAGANANSFYIETPRCFNNGRYGININDNPSGAANANSGVIKMPVCMSNGSHGIYWNNSYLGTTLIAPNCESNTGYGLYLDTLCRQNVITGGDIEANTAGNLYQAQPFYNEIHGLSVQGKTISNRAQHGTWTPVMSGGTTAGVGTYSVQEGFFEIAGGACIFHVRIICSAHTGTGQMYISLPMNVCTTSGVPAMFPVSFLTDALTLPAGAQSHAVVHRDGNRVQAYFSNAGAVGSLPVQPGAIFVSGSFPIPQPNYYLP